MIGPTGLSLKMTLVQLPAAAGAGSASPLTRRFESLLRAPHKPGEDRWAAGRGWNGNVPISRAPTRSWWKRRGRAGQLQARAAARPAAMVPGHSTLAGGVASIGAAGEAGTEAAPSGALPGP